MYNKKKYKLVNLDTKQVIELDGLNNNVEPRNWQDSEFTYVRSPKNLTETRTFSKNIEFTKNGAKFLRDAYFFMDIEANVEMYEIRFNPKTSVPYDYFIGSFDFSTYKTDKTTVKIAIESGGLEKVLKSKGNNKFELDRDTDINGESITDLRYNKFEVINRPIPLNTLLETDSEDNSSSVFRMRYGDDRRLGYYSLPFNVTYESDDKIQQVPNDLLTIQGAKRIIGGGLIFDSLESNRIQMFYYNSDRDKKLNISFNLSFYAQFRRNNNLEERFGSLVLLRFKGGENPFFLPAPNTLNTLSELRNLDEFQELLFLNDIVDGNSRTITYNNTIELNVNEGDSFGLFFVGGGEFDVFSGAATLDIDFKDINCEIKVNELSNIDVPRNSKFLFNKEVGARITEILTGENKSKYISSFFDNSDFKDTGVTSGKIIRGFSDGKIKTSFKDFIKNCQVVFNMYYNIERRNGKQAIVHEPIEYFFRREIGIKLTSQVNNVVRSVAKDIVFSSLKLGYSKPSEDNLYEEVQGLNEFNTVNEYITPITAIDKVYDQVSPYRADGEGKELTVRQHEKINPTGDYRTDNDIFNLDLKRSANSSYWQERTYSDNNMGLPENIFSPETATGLRFTPIDILKRHAKNIVGAFIKFRSKYFRYASSVGNSDLITEINGEQPQAQNEDIQISNFNLPIFVSQWIEFEYPLDFDLLQKINSSKIVDGTPVPYTYFKIEFINEFNKKEYGYLFNLKPNKEGKWKLLKAF